ncbi:MAG: hypothetical protein E4H30_02855 [Methanomassiliicoccus sp.]|nr:MAG: hypothetical protein E4H30_02855 [Methanomassiliicoccus sp.]
MQKYRMGKSRRAEMGVGTMIIFIAMVLVAAVAASVLISTANQVREQAQTTGEQAIANVATGFIVQDVVGQVNADLDNLNNVTIFLRVTSGSPNVNMDNVVLAINTGADSILLNSSINASATDFGYIKLKDVQGLPDNVVGQGDILKITIGVTGSFLDIDFNQLVEIKIMPAYGQQTLITFVTPEQFSAMNITLY